MTTKKKLYKVKTQTILYEVFEVEATSYDEALTSISKGIEGEERGFPANVDRTGWWYESREVSDFDYKDNPGLIGISITMEQADNIPYNDQVKVEGCACGWWREPTDQEQAEDDAQAVKDGRIAQTIS